MTQEPDWADREVDHCLRHYADRGVRSRAELAAALRRAKAEGLREAASLSGSLPDCIVLHASADLLDPPTPI